MGQIQHVFTSDDKDVQRAMERMIRDTAKLREENERLRKKSKQAAEGFSGAARKAVGDLKGMVTGLFTVQNAVGLVKQAYAEWRQEIEAAGQASEELRGKLVKDLGEAGLLGQADEVRDFVRGLEGATRAEGQAAIFGAAGGGPSLGFERQKAIAEEAVQVAPLTDEAGVSALSTLAAKLDTITEGKEADDLVDLARKLQQDAGDKIGTLTGDAFLKGARLLAETGQFSLEESLALGFEAQQANLSPEVVATIAAKLTQQFDTRGAQFDLVEAERGKELTPEQEARNREVLARRKFAEADEAGRLELLFDDQQIRQAVLGGEIGAKFGAIDREKVAARGEAFAGAQTGDLVEADLADFAATETGQEELRKRRQEARLDKSKVGLESAGETELEQEREAEIFINNTGAGAAKRFILNAAEGVTDFAEDVGIAPGLTATSRRSMRAGNLMAELGRGELDSSERDELVGLLKEMRDTPFSGDAEKFDQMIRLLEQQAAATERQAQATERQTEALQQQAGGAKVAGAFAGASE